MRNYSVSQIFRCKNLTSITGSDGDQRYFGFNPFLIGSRNFGLIRD